MREKEIRAFFSKRPNTTKIHIGGQKVAFSNFPEDLKKKVMDRLAEKDDVMAEGLKGILPGIKIDGRQVTRDNIHEFEKGYKPDKPITKTKTIVSPEVETEEKPKHTEESLFKLSFTELKRIASKLGETGRSKAGLIIDILKHN